MPSTFGGGRVAVAAGLRHLLGEFALPFADKGVAIGLRGGDRVGRFLLLAEIGGETRLGLDPALAGVDQPKPRREILGHQDAR